jgi:cobalt/nickel transport system permease protein
LDYFSLGGINMHMADALISPGVGVAMLAVSGVAIAYSVKKVKEEIEEKKVPLMGVMGAFVFSAQMINFTIPGTGSSGHIGGGILLAALLGPYAGLLVMTSVLLIQAMFFADGGILAFGCNVFNLGILTCFVAYPIIYRLFVNKGLSVKRITWGTIASVIVGLQLGSLGVVIETELSGKIELPINTFLGFMQPIHLVIGIFEGIIVAAVLCFIYKFSPELLEGSRDIENGKTQNYGKTLWILFFAAVFIGGILSYFASKNPDGLEWAIQGIIGVRGFEEMETSSVVMNQGVTGGVVIILFGIIAGQIIKKVKGRKY